ncbi:glutamyl-trna amidotransferase subunit a protein [Diplodia corticola]|uniref:Glutamyl-trna amidotransferase subunit a protein n=1 Tax=Diplodia corticola TaxID=236234 RepID=A0A1J9R7K2_9PEZI|nr:glutamyl-trna amidotransferase subunit a protein [Diplodia corticola]OJD36178.1 glutamyl-trna amidotransferase subunit a protein [Diplodia corticola]
MASKLIPSNPEAVTVIREVVPGTIITSSAPFLRFGRIKIGGRGTVVRMQNGALAVFSPTALTDELKKKVDSMGEVKYITALDYEHHIFLGPWYKEYPNAKVLGPEGLPEKRQKQNNENVPFAVVFEPSKKHEIKVDPEFDAEFEYEYVHAHANKEIVFNHKPTKTLIEADLIFNMPAIEQHSRVGGDAQTGFLTKFFSLFTNLQGEATGHRRFLWYMASKQDRAAFNESVERINAWDFERMIPCHGDVIEKDGKTAFQKVMKWHLDAALKKQ